MSCASAGMPLTGVWVTSTPDDASFFFIADATITDEPIPASQAMTSRFTSRPLMVRVVVAVATEDVPAVPGGIQAVVGVSGTAATASASASALAPCPKPNRAEATANETAVATRTSAIIGR